MDRTTFATLDAGQTRDELLEQHRALTAQIARLYRVHGDTLATEKEAKVRAFEQAQGSDKRREQVGSFVAVEQTKESFREWYEIQALEAERDHIRMLLAHYGLGG